MLFYCLFQSCYLRMESDSDYEEPSEDPFEGHFQSQMIPAMIPVMKLKSITGTV